MAEIDGESPCVTRSELELEAAEMEGESPDVIEGGEFILNDSPMPDSDREICTRSSSGGVIVRSMGLTFFGRGGNILLLFATAEESSLVGDPTEGGCELIRLECLFECSGIGGRSPFIVPGHGIATETSLHWNCS